MKVKILYIEDEPFLGKIVTESLEFRGYEVLHKPDGSGIPVELSGFVPDICLLDVMLPKIDGYTLGNIIRQKLPELPIIYITAKTQTSDVLKGFESGGTDYIRKPFSVDELDARIRNQLKLSKGKFDTGGTAGSAILFGSYRFIPGLNQLVIGEVIYRLSHRESQVLQYLLSNKNIVSDRKELLLSVWGDDSFFNSRNLDVYIRKLREYFADNKGIEIITLKGKGYYFKVGLD